MADSSPKWAKSALKDAARCTNEFNKLRTMINVIRDASSSDVLTRREYFFRAYLFWPYPRAYYHPALRKWCRYPKEFQSGDQWFLMLKVAECLKRFPRENGIPRPRPDKKMDDVASENVIINAIACFIENFPGTCFLFCASLCVLTPVLTLVTLEWKSKKTIRKQLLENLFLYSATHAVCSCMTIPFEFPAFREMNKKKSYENLKDMVSDVWTANWNTAHYGKRHSFNDDQSLDDVVNISPQEALSEQKYYPCNQISYEDYPNNIKKESL